VPTKSRYSFKNLLHHMKTPSIVQSCAHCFLAEKVYVCSSSRQHILMTDFLADRLAVVDQSLTPRISFCIYVHVYIYMREREREREGLSSQNVCWWYHNPSCKEDRSRAKFGESNVNPSVGRTGLSAWCDRGHQGFPCWDGWKHI